MADNNHESINPNRYKLNSEAHCKYVADEILEHMAKNSLNYGCAVHTLELVGQMLLEKSIVQT